MTQAGRANMTQVGHMMHDTRVSCDTWFMRHVVRVTRDTSGSKECDVWVTRHMTHVGHMTCDLGVCPSA